MIEPSTAITAGPPLPAPAPVPAPRPEARPLYVRILQPLASLRITVTLFALSIFLVFFGTLAQVDEGIWFVVGKYFRSAFVWVPFQIVFPRAWEVGGSFPFPGGWLLGGVLLVNLLAAHAIRFKVNWKRSGILLIHAGIVVMMLSELITGLYAVEGMMQIVEGGASNYVHDLHSAELALIRPGVDKTDEVVVIPADVLRRGRTIKHELLPCAIEVVQYMLNSDILEEIPVGRPNPATKGIGLSEMAVDKAPVTGTETGGKYDFPAAYVTFKKNGVNYGTLLVSAHHQNQRLVLDGQTYEIALRLKRTYKPYSIRLLEGRTELYPGTTTPRWYSSKIVLTDPSRGAKREVLISMNDPLRYGGETFFQSQMDHRTGVAITGLQVVRNPGWLMPYISCAMVSIGMIIHFGLHLNKFLEQRGRAAA